MIAVKINGKSYQQTKFICKGGKFYLVDEFLPEMRNRGFECFSVDLLPRFFEECKIQGKYINNFETVESCVKPFESCEIEIFKTL